MEQLNKVGIFTVMVFLFFLQDKIISWEGFKVGFHVKVLFPSLGKKFFRTRKKFFFTSRVLYLELEPGSHSSGSATQLTREEITGEAQFTII